MVYMRRYDRTIKDIFSSDFTSAQDQKSYGDIQKFISVKKVADAL